VEEGDYLLALSRYLHTSKSAAAETQKKLKDPVKILNVETRPSFLSSLSTSACYGFPVASLKVVVSSGLPAKSRSRISPDRKLPSGEPEPPCKSGQLKKDLGLEMSSTRHAARLVTLEVMRFFFVCRSSPSWNY
jgi:hypothetical protein